MPEKYYHPSQIKASIIIISILLLVFVPSLQARPQLPPPVGKKSSPKTSQKMTISQFHSNQFRLKRTINSSEYYPTSGSDTSSPDPEEDLISIVDYTGGRSNSDIFDMRRRDTLFCNLCVWIQPHYALKQGQGNLVSGVQQILEVIKLLDWNFRAMDTNLDKLPDSIALIIGDLLVQDLDLPVTSTSSRHDFVASTQVNDDTILKYSTQIGQVDPGRMLAFLEETLAFKFSSQECCASLGFIYHDIPNVLSFTSLRGLCSPHNVAVITGYKSGMKIGHYDIFRATFHALAHLFGARHDPIGGDCGDKKVSPYHNPFLMEPYHVLNVGPRPNSMKLSSCSKSDVAVFLASNLLTCLKSRVESYCGNGITEDDEECDCGAPWQCMLGDQCCGSRDSFSPCKLNNIIQALKSGRCSRPTEW